jgi:hypothetical protein
MDPIRQSVLGYSEGVHYAFFKHLIGCADIKRLLILGVYHGRDIAYLLDNARALRRPLQVVGVDKFSDDFCADWPKERQALNWQQAGFGTPPSFAAATAHLARLGFADCVTVIQERDEDFLAAYTERFDAIYIDTSHDYETVARQIRQTSGLLADGGLICGDDYSTGHLGRQACGHRIRAALIFAIDLARRARGSKSRRTVESGIGFPRTAGPGVKPTLTITANSSDEAPKSPAAGAELSEEKSLEGSVQQSALRARGKVCADQATGRRFLMYTGRHTGWLALAFHIRADSPISPIRICSLIRSSGYARPTSPNTGADVAFRDSIALRESDRYYAASSSGKFDYT